MPFPGPGAAGGSSSVLDQTPPSPALMPPGGLRGVAPPIQIGSAQMPPEVLTGIMQAGTKIGDLLDSFAQVTPDLAADWSMLKDLLQRTLGKLLVAGAGPTDPTATGNQFPTGAISRATTGATGGGM